MAVGPGCGYRPAGSPEGSIRTLTRAERQPSIEAGYPAHARRASRG
jgi:hypothetical protein